MIEHYPRPTSILEEDAGTPGSDDDRACPVCGRVDATMKASSIARSSRGRLVLEDGTYAAYESELGGLLSQPPRPEYLSVGVIAAACMVGWLLLALDLAVVAGLRAQGQVSIPAPALETATLLGIAWFGLLIPGAAVVRYFARRETVNHQLPTWREDVRRWRTFHYCSRDDVVYVPGEEQSVAPEHLPLLYRHVQPASAAVVPLRRREVQA